MSWYEFIPRVICGICGFGAIYYLLRLVVDHFGDR